MRGARHHDSEEEEEDEPLNDTTEALALHSKKLERLKKRNDRKSKKQAAKPRLETLPPEIIIEIFSFLQPSDILSFGDSSRGTRNFIHEHENSLAKRIISYRYPILSACFPRPEFFKNVDPELQPVLLARDKAGKLDLHKKSFLHVEHYDPNLICSCMTCVLAWNNLCTLVDFAYWRIQTGIRDLPQIPRGRNPQWNKDLVATNARFVRRALSSKLVYALILQRHLDTITFMIRVRGYESKRGVSLFHLSEEDVATGTDAFCARNGKPAYEFPFERDRYYSLQAYLPNRAWKQDELRWRYWPADQHLKDLEWIRSMERRRKEASDREITARIEEIRKERVGRNGVDGIGRTEAEDHPRGREEQNGTGAAQTSVQEQASVFG